MVGAPGVYIRSRIPVDVFIYFRADRCRDPRRVIAQLGPCIPAYIHHRPTRTCPYGAEPRSGGRGPQPSRTDAGGHDERNREASTEGYDRDDRDDRDNETEGRIEAVASLAETQRDDIDGMVEPLGELSAADEAGVGE